MKTIYASSIAKLDSNVHTGGGTDVTAELQAVLNGGDVHLIMDGAALVSGLVLYSNTVIECPTAQCGFFMSDLANNCLIRNAHFHMYGPIEDHDIHLIGGTYNQNCMNQYFKKDPKKVGDAPTFDSVFDDVMEFEFYGVENLYMRDVHIRDERTYALLAANWKNIVMEGVVMELPNFMFASHQDGLHFFGPGQFLTIRDLRGTGGDDIINIGPDEHDGKSSITDVLIDGVFFENAKQGIRMLSRDQGRLDRVTVKNVTGTYHTFAFSINSWVPNEYYGNFGSLYFENIDVRQLPALHDYTPQMFCWFGGNFDSVIFKNVRVSGTVDSRPYFEIGVPFLEKYIDLPKDNLPKFKYFEVDGFTVLEDVDAPGADYFIFYEKTDHIVLRDINIFREGTPAGSVVSFPFNGGCDTLSIADAYVKNTEDFVKVTEGHKVGRLIANNVVCDNVTTGFVDAPAGTIGKKILSGITEL